MHTPRIVDGDGGDGGAGAAAGTRDRRLSFTRPASLSLSASLPLGLLGLSAAPHFCDACELPLPWRGGADAFFTSLCCEWARQCSGADADAVDPTRRLGGRAFQNTQCALDG